MAREKQTKSVTKPRHSLTSSSKVAASLASATGFRKPCAVTKTQLRLPAAKRPTKALPHVQQQRQTRQTTAREQVQQHLKSPTPVEAHTPTEAQTPPKHPKIYLRFTLRQKPKNESGAGPHQKKIDEGNGEAQHKGGTRLRFTLKDGKAVKAEVIG